MMSDWISVLSLGIAILGIPIAIWATKHFSTRAGLAFTVTHEKVFDTDESTVPSELNISLGSEPITNFHRWRFGVWNSGNSTFEEGDIIESDPLSISIDGHRILDIQGGYVSREAISPNFEILDGKTLKPSFQICDKSDGFVFFVFSQEFEESKESDYRKRVQVGGSLRGLPNGLKKGPAPLKLERADVIIMSIFAVLFICMGVFLLDNGYDLISELADPVSDDIVKWLGLPTAAAAWLTGIGGLFSAVFGISAGGLGCFGLFALVRFFWSVPLSVRQGFEIESSDMKFDVTKVSRMIEIK